jgi:hypothetical protein
MIPKEFDTYDDFYRTTGFTVEEFERIRLDLADLGFRIMHRRDATYWVMFDKPMTVEQMNRFACNWETGAPATPTPESVWAARPEELELIERKARLIDQLGL